MSLRSALLFSLLALGLLVPSAATARTSPPHRHHRAVRKAAPHRHHRAVRKVAPVRLSRTVRGASAAPSAWEQPTLTNPTTVFINSTHRNLVLDQHRDYIVACPPAPVLLTQPLIIWGGHNVVFANCHLTLTVPNWAAQFKNQTGTLWISNVRFGGTRLTGGLQLQEPGATVVMRDVLFDTVHGSYTTNHAELIQTWSGPGRLLIDGLTGTTTYQGLFLLPNEFDSGPAPTIFDLRNVNIDNSHGAYALWLDDVTGGISAMQLNLQNVYVQPNPARLWPGWWQWPQPSPGGTTWSNVIASAPPGGSYVHATSNGASGVDENVSPAALPGE